MFTSPVSATRRDRISLRRWAPMLLAVSLSAAAEAPRILQISPKGTYRIEHPAAGEEDWIPWIVSTRDPTQRTKLPQEDAQPFGDFSFSPDEQWLALNVHYGSRMAGFRLFRIGEKAKIEQILDEKPAWAWLDRQKIDGKLAADMMRQLAWSSDSVRLLLRAPVGDDPVGAGRPTADYFLYYNLRKRGFEMTDYLRDINRNALQILQSDKPERLILKAQAAEPVEPLPVVEDLRARYESSDAELNKVYAALMKKLNAKPEDQTLLRDYQRNWLKLRDAGADAFAAKRAKADQARFRQYYLANATAARVDELQDWLARVAD